LFQMLGFNEWAQAHCYAIKEALLSIYVECPNMLVVNYLFTEIKELFQKKELNKNKKNTQFQKNIKDVFPQNTKLPTLNKQKNPKKLTSYTNLYKLTNIKLTLNQSIRKS
jgi:hypothetical protein